VGERQKSLKIEEKASQRNKFRWRMMTTPATLFPERVSREKAVSGMKATSLTGRTTGRHFSELLVT